MENIETVLRDIQSHASTHPVIVAMWSEYLGGLRDACAQACEQARTLVKDLPAFADPSSYQQVAALYALTRQ